MAKAAVLALLLACVVCAQAIVPRVPVNLLALAGINSTALVNAARTPGAASVSSCAGASVSVSGSGGASASASSNAQAYIKPATACSEAIKDFAAKAQAKACGKAALTTWIYLSAEACAKTGMELRVKSAVEAKSWGKGRASSYSCADASGMSAAYAKGIASALGEVMASSSGKCTALTSSQVDAKVKTVASVMMSAFVSTWASASTVGNGQAKATATALWKSDVQVYAKAIADLAAWGCITCDTRCRWCSGADGLQAISEVVPVMVGDRYAMATLFSNVQGSLCLKRNSDKPYVTVSQGAWALLDSYVDMCISVVSRASASLAASGSNSNVCVGAISEGNVQAMGLATADVAYDAVSLAFKGDQCMLDAYTNLLSKVVTKFSVKDVYTAMTGTCKMSERNKPVAWSDVKRVCMDNHWQQYGNATADAISEAAVGCTCNAAGYCCDFPRCNPQCSF